MKALQLGADASVDVMYHNIKLLALLIYNTDRSLIMNMQRILISLDSRLEAT